MTRRSLGITHCLTQCSIQKHWFKWEKTVSHASHIISMNWTRPILCLDCALTQYFLHFLFPNWKSISWKGLYENTENIEMSRVRLPSKSWMFNHKSSERQQWTEAEVTEIKRPVQLNYSVPWLLQENFLERQHLVQHFTNLDCVGEWPDGRRQQTGVCNKAGKDSCPWCKRLWFD